MGKKIAETLPKYLTRKEIEAMIEECGNIRDELILLFMYNIGARVSELINFRIEDIDFENNSVSIFRGKGAKDRTVNISKDFAQLLRAFVRRKDKGTLFISNHGKPFTPRAIQKKIKSIAMSAGLAYIDKITPHSLRHTHAVHALQSGVNIVSIKKHLGHKNLKTTMVYTEISDEIVKKDFEDHKPFKLKKEYDQKSLKGYKS
ncbi:MAG: tyrosine-type recombinase/integrase [Nanoarchaeota archaeon]|nr:tyrosine-type recombinase/integrase [Nanoarchaeota archaeon]